MYWYVFDVGEVISRLSLVSGWYKYWLLLSVKINSILKRVLWFILFKILIVDFYRFVYKRSICNFKVKVNFVKLLVNNIIIF